MPRFINPDTIAPPPGQGFTHVVEVPAGMRMVFIAGQLGLDRKGDLAGGPGDFRAQAVQAFENLKAALEAVGAGFGDVVKLNNYLLDIRHLAILREVRQAYFVAGTPPASTSIAVSGFARDGALYEVEAVAVVPDR
jgi:enamine deaminase RidA (YjgF/YER057c/UK114 family)